MGQKSTYTAEHHKKAYELWLETKNASKVARTLGIAPMTLYRWRDVDFHCDWHCPYHDWATLDNATARAQAARNALMDAGVNDPVKLELAMREQVERSGQTIDKIGHEAKHGDYPSMELIRRKDAVIGDWEYLYRKAYWLATGVVLAPDQVVLTPEQEKEQGELYARGIKFKDMEGAIKSLALIRQEIAALHSSGDTKVSLEEITTTKRVTLTLEQLTKAREQLLEIKKTGRPAPLTFDAPPVEAPQPVELLETTDEEPSDDQ